MKGQCTQQQWETENKSWGSDGWRIQAWFHCEAPEGRQVHFCKVFRQLLTLTSLWTLGRGRLTTVCVTIGIAEDLESFMQNEIAGMLGQSQQHWFKDTPFVGNAPVHWTRHFVAINSFFCDEKISELEDLSTNNSTNCFKCSKSRSLPFAKTVCLLNPKWTIAMFLCEYHNSSQYQQLSSNFYVPPYHLPISPCHHDESLPGN